MFGFSQSIFVSYIGPGEGMSEHEGRLENLEMLIAIEGKILLDDLDKTLTNCARDTARFIKKNY